MTTIILFAPLLGALIAGFGWRLIGETAAQWLTTGLLFLACLLSWIVFLGFDGETRQIELMRWIQSGALDTSWAIRLDRLTAIMLIVVTTVSALVHLYSMGYMAHDENWKHGEHYKARFFAYLSFFTFTMLMLVTANNLVQMFFGWEGVGVASYLLIGFYYRKPSANAAAIKAFVVNRVGDFGFALGIFGLFLLTDSIDFDVIFAEAPRIAQTQLTFLWREWNAANLLAFLLFVGAMGKSAQLFLHTWLPDAMEGPTPVSALIHAATMVTAGVFLVCRMSPLLEYAPETKTLIMYVGAATAFFAATVGLVQNDIKRVIAYSTCSQLGYMFVAAGAGVYSVAMFHLFTHAFFKAMLFLGAGSVIHAMHHEQDMRHYGGLRKKIPYTFAAMLIGTLAITGVGIPMTTIGFAGFLSKDAIIESAWASGNGFAFWALVLSAGMTSFYSWRLMFLTFFGTPREAPSHGHSHGAGHGHDGHGSAHANAHESPMVMLVPLGVLALGAVFSGMIWYKSFFGDHATVLQFFGMETHEGAEAEEPETAGTEGEAAESGATEGEAAATEPAATGETAAAGETATTDAADGEAAESGATEGEAAATEDTATEPAAGETPATEPAATEEAPGEAVASEMAASGHAAAGVAPKGAIFMGPDNDVLNQAHEAPEWVKLSPFVAMVIGLALAVLMYLVRTDLPARLATQQRPLYNFLLNKWYFDEIYDFLFVRPARALGRLLWTRGDQATIDGTINGVAMGVIPFFTRLAGRMQSGYLFHYAFAMVIGIAVLITWMSLSGGR